MRLDAVPFNLDVTLCCGQVFRWDKKGDWWYGVVEDHALKVRQTGSELELARADETLVVHYFGLDDDLQKISASIGKDEHIKKALKAFNNFSYSHKKEYLEWVTNAKTEETRNKRLATTIKWLTEGKDRNWKYRK